VRDIKSYESIIRHYESCLEKYGDSYKGMDWPIENDAEKRYTVMLDLIKNDVESSVLDFGCGTALLLDFIKRQGIENIKYSGLDLIEKSIQIANQKFPEVTFYCHDILQDQDRIPKFDYIVLNGVFTEKRELEYEEMLSYFKSMVHVLFSKIEKGMAFNVMSKAVDWERWDLFHLSTDVLIDFLAKEVSRNFIIRNDYGLYEYTVYIYK
jgi:SAM-dependent methyltransferase